jgi:hypothetical protein
VKGGCVCRYQKYGTDYLRYHDSSYCDSALNLKSCKKVLPVEKSIDEKYL